MIISIFTFDCVNIFKHKGALFCVLFFFVCFIIEDRTSLRGKRGLKGGEDNARRLVKAYRSALRLSQITRGSALNQAIYKLGQVGL